MQPVHEDKQTNKHTSQCNTTAIILNAELRNGYKSGIFKYHSHVKTMEHCEYLCCISFNCDVAYMNGNKCFTVKCFSDDHCQWITNKSKKTKLAYFTSHDRILNLKKGIELNSFEMY